MVQSFGPTTSRVFDYDAKSLQLLVARSGKAITDAEGILLQELQALKIKELTSLLTYSGCVDTPPYRFPGVEDTTLTKNNLIIPAFRALIKNEFVWVQGTNNSGAPINSDNYLSLPAAPSSKYAIVVVYLEAWYQQLNEVTNVGFFNTPNSSYFYPWGNILADSTWITQPNFLNDLQDPLIGVTSGRVQLQYALRATQIIPQLGTATLTDYLKDFGMTHPSLYGQSQNRSTSPFVFAGSRDPGLYVSSSSQLQTIDGNTYAIPLAIFYQRNSGTFDPVLNPHGTSLQGSGGGVASGQSGRPDGRFFDVPYTDDIIDTRSSFLGGNLEDYQSTIKQAANRLWNGTLRLKLAETPDSDPTAHQLGQTLLSQEFIGVGTTTPMNVTAPIASLSANATPALSWTADISPETLTMVVIPSMKDVPSSGVPSPNQVTWASGDTITLSHPSSAVINAVALYTFNQQAQVLKIPPAYATVSGVGTRTIKISILDIGVDIRFDLTQPIWVQTTFVKAGSFEHLRYVPSKMYPPIFMDSANMGSSTLPCGAVSDYAMMCEDSVAFNQQTLLRSYKKNYNPYKFGTVRRVKYAINQLSLPGATVISAGVSPTVVFQASNQSVQTSAMVLSWNVLNATRVTLKNATTGISLGDVPAVGSLTIQVLQATQFLLTAYNGTTVTPQVIDVTPLTDAGGSSVLTGQTTSQTFPAPGGVLNPENINAPYAIASLPLYAGMGNPLQHVMLGGISATLYQQDLAGNWATTDLQIHHQYITDNTNNTGLASCEIGVFGQWDLSNSTDYIEFELLVVGEKTFHYNPAVQGITGVTETVAPSQTAYLYFSPSKTGLSGSPSNYYMQSYPDYPNGALEVTVSVPTKNWSGQTLGGVFEGCFGYDGQAYAFVQMSTDTFYRAVPCSVHGMGTPLLTVRIPQITLIQVQDVMVLAQVSTTLSPTSTTLLSYNYVPYQGEGDPSDTYSLVHMSDEALITTFGTGNRSVPGLSAPSSVNPRLPIASILPSMTGWEDSDLKSMRFEVSGASSSLGHTVYSTADFLKTTTLSTISGNISNLLNISADSFPALSPRSPAQRGFSKNIVAFAYVVDKPVLSAMGAEGSSPVGDTTYWVNVLSGDDANSGLSGDAPKRSLQNLLRSLPNPIRNTITINLSGETTLSTEVIPDINIADEVPYGAPGQNAIYALIQTSFITEGLGKVIIQKDPLNGSMAAIIVPDTNPFTDHPLYGWLHTSGRLVLKNIGFTAPQGTILAAYPKTSLTLDSCAFEGGHLQMLNYGAEVSVSNSSFNNTLQDAIIVTSGGILNMGAGMVFTKYQHVGSTLIVEKNSVVNILEPFEAMFYAAYDSGNPDRNVEFLIKQYSTLDTHFAPTFKFFYDNSFIKMSSFSTLVYSTERWFGTLLTTDNTTLAVSQVSI